jgi:hypothetical protein
MRKYLNPSARAIAASVMPAASAQQQPALSAPKRYHHGRADAALFCTIDRHPAVEE